LLTRNWRLPQTAPHTRNTCGERQHMSFERHHNSKQACNLIQW
jgi:hypothetical protein